MIVPDKNALCLEQPASSSGAAVLRDEDMSFLRMVSHLARYNRSIREIADLVLSYARKSIPCDGSALLGMTRRAHRLASLGSDRMSRILLRDGKDAARKAMSAAAPVSRFDGPGGGTLVCAPIRSSSRVLGCFLTYWIPGREPRRGEMRKIELIARVAHFAAHHYRAMESHGRLVSVLIRKDRQIRRLTQLALIGQRTAETMHEISNAVTAIHGWAEMLCTARGAKEQRVYAQNLVASAGSFAERARQILGFATGKKCRNEIVDLGLMVQGILHTVGPTFSRRGISLTFTPPGEKIELLTQRFRLEQILRNVIENARDALETGRARRVSIAMNRGADRVIVEIEDSGRGIPEGMEQRIFEPFVTTKPHGTGLGLSISRKIARELGGDLLAEHARGRGARFILELPLDKTASGNGGR